MEALVSVETLSVDELLGILYNVQQRDVYQMNPM